MVQGKNHQEESGLADAGVRPGQEKGLGEMRVAVDEIAVVLKSHFVRENAEHER
jgi:hypothetical protein